MAKHEGLEGWIRGASKPLDTVSKTNSFFSPEGFPMSLTIATFMVGFYRSIPLLTADSAEMLGCQRESALADFRTHER